MDIVGKLPAMDVIITAVDEVRSPHLNGEAVGGGWFTDYKEHLSIDEIAEWFVQCYEEDDHESADEIAREYNLYQE